MNFETYIKWCLGFLTLIVVSVGKLIWNNHQSIADLKKELAGQYPTWPEMTEHLQKCSDDKDKQMQSIITGMKEIKEDSKADMTYIRNKLDQVINRELNSRSSDK